MKKLGYFLERVKMSCLFSLLHDSQKRRPKEQACHVISWRKEDDISQCDGLLSANIQSIIHRNISLHLVPCKISPSIPAAGLRRFKVALTIEKHKSNMMKLLEKPRQLQIEGNMEKIKETCGSRRCRFLRKEFLEGLTPTGSQSLIIN